MTKLLTVLSILCLSLCTSCGPVINKDEFPPLEEIIENEKVLPFETYLNQIPTIKLPLKMKCEVELGGSTLDFNRLTIDTYGKENSKIYGKITVNDNFTAIVYLYPADIILPVLQTTDRSGNKISELSMYEKWCGEDQFSIGTSWSKINEDLTITLSDSVSLYKRNETGEIIEESKTIEVRHRLFQIDHNGVIIEK